jgi:hypothetical protein
MSDLQATFQAVLSLFKMEFTLYGFTFSWWQVFFWSIVAGLLIWFIGRIFNE